MKHIIALFSAVCLSACGLAEHVYPTNPAPDSLAFFGQLGRDNLVATNVPPVVEKDPIFSLYKQSQSFTNDVRDATCGVYVPLTMSGMESLVVSGSADVSFRNGGALYILSGGLLNAMNGAKITIETNAEITVLGSRNFSDFGLQDPSSVYLPKAGGTITGELNVNDHITSNDGFLSYGSSLFDGPVSIKDDIEFFKGINVNDGSYMDIKSEANFYEGTTLWIGDPANVIKLAYENGSHWRSNFGSYETLDERITRISTPPDYSTNNTALVTTTRTIVREANGGVWDATLGVWWTPVMSNGKLTYQATTNVNLNAGN